MLTIPIGVNIIMILFGSSLAGLLVSRFLPHHHLSAETKSVVSVSITNFAALAALVLGLLLSTASTYFAGKAQELAGHSTELIRLDHLLRRYGPEAQEVRLLLHRYTAAELRELFPKNANKGADLTNDALASLLDEVAIRIQALGHASDSQRWLRAQALHVAAAVQETRWHLAQEDPTQIPFPVLALVVFWFAIIFASFGLCAPRNLTAILAIFFWAVGVGTAVRMTRELHLPFQGLIRISSTPLKDALEAMSR